MNLANELTEMSINKTKKVVVLGKHGVGKTSLIKNFSNDEVIILDFERGLLPLAGLGYKSVSPTAQKMQEYVDEITKGGAGITGKTIVIDSVTELSTVMLEDAKRRCPKNDLQAYGVMISEMSTILRKLMKQDNCDVVLLCAIEQKIINDSNGQIEVQRPMIDTSRMAGRLNFTSDGVFVLADAKGVREIYTQGALSGGLRCKDRSGKLGRVEEPDIKKILEKMRGATAEEAA
jgi:hypothetical protein